MLALITLVRTQSQGQLTLEGRQGDVMESYALKRQKTQFFILAASMNMEHYKNI